MSRRRGEFEHRTSIFEGAFRAWSHLGGLDPEELETKSASELDPLINLPNDDPRMAAQKEKEKEKEKKGGGSGMGGNGSGGCINNSGGNDYDNMMSMNMHMNNNTNMYNMDSMSNAYTTSMMNINNSNNNNNNNSNNSDEGNSDGGYGNNNNEGSNSNSNHPDGTATDPDHTPDHDLTRSSNANSNSGTDPTSGRREYPYEPLPRSGLAHPFVQAILSPWLGPDADQDAIQLGLTTLRTWWQHRRKGESGSAVVALGTEKMQGVVEGYTRHFFNLAHCLVVNDKEQPPRSLHAKIRQLEKAKGSSNYGANSAGGGGGGGTTAKKNNQKKRVREEESVRHLANITFNSAGLPETDELTQSQTEYQQQLQQQRQQQQQQRHGGGGMSDLPGDTIGGMVGGMGMGMGGMGMGMGMEMEMGMGTGMGMGLGMGGGILPTQDQNKNNSNLTPLERLHAAQRRQLAESGGVHSRIFPGGGVDLLGRNNAGGGPTGGATGEATGGATGQQQSVDQSSSSGPPQIGVRGKCSPGKLNLPRLVQQVSTSAARLTHGGPSSSFDRFESGGGEGGSEKRGSMSMSGGATSSGTSVSSSSLRSNSTPAANFSEDDFSKYGDPDTAPLVISSENGGHVSGKKHWRVNESDNGNDERSSSSSSSSSLPSRDLQFMMYVDGITCAHCVKIVETVLRGCNNNNDRSPIRGLLDAAADRELNIILIKIRRTVDAKRIAYEAARNLSMVGYASRAMEMKASELGSGNGGNNGGQTVKNGMDIHSLCQTFDALPDVQPVTDLFNWTLPCACPDNGVVRTDCPRHTQMSQKIVDTFDRTTMLVRECMSSCGKRFGMPCAIPMCLCKATANALGISASNLKSLEGVTLPLNQSSEANNGANDEYSRQQQSMKHLQQQIMMMKQQSAGNIGNNLGTSLQYGGAVGMSYQKPIQDHSSNQGGNGGGKKEAFVPNLSPTGGGGGGGGQRAQRNSMISLGGLGGRQMSLTSEGTTFGRAMSGLSALSIDWENMDDFDVNVDHSANINNDIINRQERRSSLQRKNDNMNVSFNI